MFDCQEGIGNKPFAEAVEEIYHRLYTHFGPQDWWPGDTPLEVAIGAILTQAVNWSNVEKAIGQLKDEGLIDPFKLYQVEQDRLACLIKPTGYYNMKARKVKAFINFLVEEFEGSIELMLNQPLVQARESLLDIYGIGPETADSILLYAGEYPIFVIDAYTKRIFSRCGLVSADIEYHDLQTRITGALPGEVEMYNEYHALLVALGKDKCLKNNPHCQTCPLSLS